jgi:DNA end-binding protein Ku
VRINSATGKEVPWENIIKGYEYDKNTILPVDENEIEYVAEEGARNIAIAKFVDKNSIDFINVEKTYYLVPDKKNPESLRNFKASLKRK